MLQDKKNRREYYSGYHKDYYRKNRVQLLAKQKVKNVTAWARKRLWLWEIKEKLGCSRCTEKHPACLQFHHRNPSTKEFTIALAMRWSKERILKEIEKCDLLCANCHAKEHWPDIRNRSLASSPKR